MKSLKHYLVIVTILLCVALGFGVYVWYIVQKVDTRIPSETDATPTIIQSKPE